MIDRVLSSPKVFMHFWMNIKEFKVADVGHNSLA